MTNTLYYLPLSEISGPTSLHPPPSADGDLRSSEGTGSAAAVPWASRRSRRRRRQSLRSAGDSEVGGPHPASEWRRRVRPSRPSPLYAGIRGRVAAGRNGSFAQTHQKSAGARCVLGSEPLRAANACKPVRRVYKRRKQISDLKNESLSIHWGWVQLWVAGLWEWSNTSGGRRTLWLMAPPT